MIVFLLLFAIILVILEYVITREKGMWGLSLIVAFLIIFSFLIPTDFIIIAGMSLFLLLTFVITYYFNWFRKKSSIDV